ncbi:hypothetical protein [Polynucleobacter necessarius]|uniref:hypothetical protein n=1 Tax=Polynucleobacter necessarius TaxID=576610 RepID=UPI000E09D6B1|nr:hypothetical protein [Polynucleobacter necessarius]
MKSQHIKPALFVTLAMLFVSACTMAKLEARLEANPQCKDIINPKTGTLMPCPGTDKSFYRSAGLEPAKPSPTAPAVAAAASAANTPTSTSIANPAAQAPITSNTPVVQPDCKPQIHKKTGGMLPCPPAD